MISKSDKYNWHAGLAEFHSVPYRKIVVVIPTKDQGSALLGQIDSLLASDFPIAEIVVVSAGLKDFTFLQGSVDVLPVNVMYILARGDAPTYSDAVLTGLKVSLGFDPTHIVVMQPECDDINDLIRAWDDSADLQAAYRVYPVRGVWSKFSHWVKHGFSQLFKRQYLKDPMNGFRVFNARLAKIVVHLLWDIEEIPPYAFNYLVATLRGLRYPDHLMVLQFPMISLKDADKVQWRERWKTAWFLFRFRWTNI